MFFPVVALCLAASAAEACSLPVYRYALERWYREPYLVLRFSDGKTTPQDAKTREFLKSRAEETANIVLREVDVAKIEEKGKSSIVRKAWERNKAKGVPLYVIFAPGGIELFAGKLSSEDAARLLSSPKRTDVATALCRGRMVLLLLRSGDAKADKAAAKVLAEVRASAEAEELPVSIIEVDRADPEEQWLVRQLLSAEDDLAGIKSPMVFGIIGRGHVLPPYVGRGIYKENLEEFIMIMTGPCTCDMKVSQQGLDLLTDWDWDGYVFQLAEGEGGPLPLGVPSPAKETAPSPPASPEKSEPPFERRVAIYVVAAAGVLAIFVLALGFVIWRRSAG